MTVLIYLISDMLNFWTQERGSSFT